MEQTWNDYYVNNDEVILLINEWRNAEAYNKIKTQKIILDKLSFFIYAKIKTYRKEHFYNDLYQEGMIGLLDALNSFDQEKGNNFFLIASWCVSNRIGNFLRKMIRQRNEIPCENIAQFIKGQNISPQECYENKEQEKTIQDALKRLPEAYKRILVMKYGIFESEKYTFQQIGEIFSVSKQYIEQIEKRALIKLKKDNNIRKYFL